MASAYSRLPPELLLMILPNLPDLPSLYKFICASSIASAAFTIDAANILNDVIERSIPHFKTLARVIAVIGSLDIQSKPKTSRSKLFDSLIAKYASLPEGMLVNDTLGARYLLLTAYRVEHLMHICITTLLQNIHEHIFTSQVDENTPFDKLCKLKSLRHGVFFTPAAWWSPSWVERFRVERALWKLFIYWNIRTICCDNILEDDPGLSQYNEKILDINSDIGVEKGQDGVGPREIDEVNCVSEAIREFLDCNPMIFFTELFAHRRQLCIEKAWSKCSLSLNETESWRFEEPQPLKGTRDDPWGQGACWTTKSNSKFSEFGWRYWHSFNSDNLHLERHDLWFPDYLGLCLWDYKRLQYLGLNETSASSLDHFLGPPREPDMKFSSPNIWKRWVDLFIHELARLPGGGKQKLSKDCKERIRKWKAAVRLASKDRGLSNTG
ncbi:uncharacterized protein TRUGW13939_05305 [Talaromyces rugulosus]|uniref:F-box domain-containing protein n=1 Tax=Talaromyces rugulosus TaxID=121627 RepID=A0A7H8QVW3_TALRU|nr:uncharacterized protein TRUGW13939_05305 [Talaromyces rugulosus]QKX58184.1 hypothetical protein TRUGW13939_05305 [Talaromyces rugulosus]